MDELTPADKQKSGVTPVIRLTWAPEGDEVFVYASEYLGTLDVSLKDDDVRYAYLSGTIDYNGQSSISDQLVNFSFATSVVNVNCIGLATDGQNQEQIEKASISGLNTACQLSLSATAAPGVSGVALGDITRSSNFTSSELKVGKFFNVMYNMDVHVESVSLDIENKDIEAGEDFTLTATVMPEDALIKDVNWSSSNEDVATVDENGKVKGVAEGSATITATTVESDVNAARCVIFNSDGELSITDEKRSTAHCIRLVCDCN